MRRMNEEELNDEQLDQLDDLQNAAAELLDIMSDYYHDGNVEDVYKLIEYAQLIIERRGMRAHFPAHIDDGVNSYTIDYTDEEIKGE